METELRTMFGMLPEQKRVHDVTTEPEQDKDRPNKAAKTDDNNNGKGKGHRPKAGRRVGANNGSGGSQRSFQRQVGADEPEGLNEGMMLLMARLLLRQDEAITVMRQSTGFVLWVRTSPAVLLPKIVGAAKLWKERAAKPDNPMSMTSLRSTLLWTLLHQCVVYVEQVTREAEPMQHATQQGWLNSSGQWAYQVWDHTNKVLKVDGEKEPMHHEALLTLLKELKALVTQDTISRFHATRPILGELKGPLVTFILDVSFRTAASNEMYSKLCQLIGLSALQGVGLQIKKEGFKRSPGIQKLHDMLHS